jgi:hypothetical protein
MSDWENRIAQKYPEEEAIITRYFDLWTAEFMSGNSIPAPQTDWQRLAAVGFTLFFTGLRNAGVKF